MNIRNSEHYMDTTPFYALSSDSAKAGDVFEYNGKTVLVLARKDNVTVTLRLIKSKDPDGMINVCDDWFTDVYQVCYTYINRLGTFRFSVSNAELKAVKQRMSDALGLDTTAPVTPSADPVKHPNHYKSKYSDRECLDEMRLMFGIEAVITWARLNVFKYRFRADQKNGEEDRLKAEENLNIIERLKGQEHGSK